MIYYYFCSLPRILFYKTPNPSISPVPILDFKTVIELPQNQPKHYSLLSKLKKSPIDCWIEVLLGEKFWVLKRNHL